jgi:hypothetical protein
MRDARQQQEIISIVMAAAAGEASDEQLSRISRLVLEDEEASIFALQLLSQEAWLTWHASQAQGVERQAAISEQIGRLVEAPDSGRQALPSAVRRRAFGETIARATAGLPADQRPIDSYRLLPWNRVSKRFWSLSIVAAALLLVLGASFGALVTRWFGGGSGMIAQPDQSGARLAADAASKPLPANYEARLMHGTACVWSPEMRSRLGSHDSLHSGDALNLIAGLAEVELSWPMRGNATLRLEGPAALVLMADGGTSLNYGKLTANVLLKYDNFAVETPVGRVVVTDDARIGVAVSGGTVEVHVFQGHAEVIASWASGTGAPDRLPVRGGRSIRLRSTDSGAVDLVRGPAMASRFASQVSMGSDLLEISDEYVQTITEAAPIVYWRFNMPVNDLVKNDMGDRYSARVEGKPSWIDERGNMSVEFGTGLDADELRAMLVADEPFQRLKTRSYAIELWAKPSHYHLGTMASLVLGGSQDNISKGAHGVLLELGGQRAYSSIEHPGRVRFLHRDPPSGDPAAGTSCFSSEPYKLRKWQYIVAVKDDTEMRLYVDARLVASAADATEMSDSLELLVGQMDRHRDWRPFVGQLDELAFYNRALSEEEIQHHFHLVRPKRAASRGI